MAHLYLNILRHIPTSHLSFTQPFLPKYRLSPGMFPWKVLISSLDWAQKQRPLALLLLCAQDSGHTVLSQYIFFSSLEVGFLSSGSQVLCTQHTDLKCLLTAPYSSLPQIFTEHAIRQDSRWQQAKTKKIPAFLNIYKFEFAWIPLGIFILVREKKVT